MNDSPQDAQPIQAAQTPEATSQGFSPISQTEVFNKVATRFLRKLSTTILKKKKRIKSVPFNKAEYSQKVRNRVIKAYGSECACCFETIKEFLTIDHILGDGKKDRETIGSGVQFYRYLEKNGFPKDRYRLLCMNCNFVRRFGKECPHNDSNIVSHSKWQIHQEV